MSRIRVRQLAEFEEATAIGDRVRELVRVGDLRWPGVVQTREDAPLRLELSREAIDETARTVAATLSTAVPAERFFGTEVLEHSARAVDLHRAEPNGLMLLYQHDRDRPIGRVRDLAVDESGARLRGVLHFSDNADAREIWPQVRDGWLAEMSIGYRVHTWEVDEDEERWTATRWELMEASVVTVPLDHASGVNRSEGGQTMPQDTRHGGTPADEGANVASFEAARSSGRQTGRSEGASAERARVTEIETIAEAYAHDPEARAVRADAIANGWSVEAFLRRLLELRATPAAAPAARDAEESGPQRRAAPARAGEDALDKFRDGVTEYLQVRGGLVTERPVVERVRGSEFSGLTLFEIGREYLRRAGVPAGGSRAHQIGLMFTTRAGMHGQSDFPSILENTARKSLMMGFDEAEETWRRWCKVTSLSDFKPTKRVGVSAFSDLARIAASGEYTEGHVSDLAEQIQLGSFGKIFNVTRQAIIDDDLGALTDIPRKLGMAAARVPGDLAYGVLTANAVMLEDGVALFHATHNNIGTVAGAPGTGTIGNGTTLMGLQRSPAPATGETGARLNLSPRWLITPKALEWAAIQATTAEFDTDDDVSQRKPNVVRGRVEPIADARLDTTSAVVWYLAANAMATDTVEVAGLDGPPEPMIEQQDPWTVSGVSWRVTLDAAAAAIGWRGLVRNPGA